MNKEHSETYILYGASFNPPHIGHFSAISQMLEEHDKVIVFPYPKKFVNGNYESLPPINQRMKMLQIFALNFFPQMSERLIIVNLAKLIEKENIEHQVLHTYDYLNFVKTQIPNDAKLKVCLGFDSQNLVRKENFYNEDKIKVEYEYFFLQEENKIKSSDLRAFFSTHKNIKSKKDEEYIRSAVGNSLAEYIFTNNLYGLKAKKINKKLLENESVMVTDNGQEEPILKPLKKLKM